MVRYNSSMTYLHEEASRAASSTRCSDADALCSFRFFDLPQEIRLLVYQSVLGSSYITGTLDTSGRLKITEVEEAPSREEWQRSSSGDMWMCNDSFRRRTPALLAACTQARREALPILRQSVSLNINVAPRAQAPNETVNFRRTFPSINNLTVELSIFEAVDWYPVQPLTSQPAHGPLGAWFCYLFTVLNNSHQAQSPRTLRLALSVSPCRATHPLYASSRAVWSLRDPEVTSASFRGVLDVWNSLALHQTVQITTQAQAPWTECFDECFGFDWTEEKYPTFGKDFGGKWDL